MVNNSFKVFFFLGCWHRVGTWTTWTMITFGKWLTTMVIVSPLRIGLWDPFQMAFSWLPDSHDETRNLLKFLKFLQAHLGFAAPQVLRKGNFRGTWSPPVC